MSINISIPRETELKPRITVIGVGGAGGNAVNNMIRSNLEGVDFLVCNTDSQALAMTMAERRIQLGTRVTQGLGAGSRPEIGRAAAEEALEEILEHLNYANMVFITAGMGGGTGTGAAPVIARAARERNILTVGVITKPFHFEGAHRMRIAEAGIEELQEYVDTLIIIPNQNLFRVANEKTTFADAFKMADDVLYSGVRGVTDLMVMPGLINLDFADIRTVMSEMGKAMMGTGEAEGDKRAIDAAEAAIANPLLEDASMKGAKGVLINITGGLDMTLFEVDEAANRIREEVDSEANIIFGSTFDDALKGRMRVSVVATGINIESAQQRPPRPALTVVGQPARMAAPARAAAQPAMAQPITLGQTALAREPVAAPIAAPVVATAPALAVAQPMAQPMAQPAIEPAPLPVAPVLAEPAVAVAPVPAIDKAPGGPALEARAEPVMAPIELAPAPAPAPAPTPAPRPAMTALGQPFIAPRPAAASARAEAGVADPFAAAAMANGPREKPRSPSLFQRVVGIGRTQPAESLFREPATSKPAAAARPASPPAPAKPAQSAQARLGHLDPSDRLGTSAEDDLLDIPAFLRRQAN
ncbi:MAG: cell division protein FtsZ [Proteobacteria bacterium]|nr:cell division protein FtsZ [Pseudomonadota bacterium]